MACLSKNFTYMHSKQVAPFLWVTLSEMQSVYSWPWQTRCQQFACSLHLSTNILISIDKVMNPESNNYLVQCSIILHYPCIFHAKWIDWLQHCWTSTSNPYLASHFNVKLLSRVTRCISLRRYLYRVKRDNVIDYNSTNQNCNVRTIYMCFHNKITW